MEFIIHPYEGIEILQKGIIRFGMSREELTIFLREQPKNLLKGGEKKIQTDSFREAGFLAYYNDVAHLEAIEFFLPDAEVYLNTEKLTGLSNSQLRDLIQKYDKNLVDTDCGFDSLVVGIASYSPNPDDKTVEGLMVFRKGYLDRAK